MFQDLQRDFESNLREMLAGSARLYETVPKEDVLRAKYLNDIWALYLNNLPEAINPVYKIRTEHDCSACLHFIQRYGGLVTITPQYNLRSIWNFVCSDGHYQRSLALMSEMVESNAISDVFITGDKVLGQSVSRTLDEIGNVISFSHFSFRLPSELVLSGSESVDTVKGRKRTAKECLLRALTEVTEEAVQETLELISQGSLYRGESWKNQLELFQRVQQKTKTIPTNAQMLNFCWMIADRHPEIGRLRNSSIGTLLVDLSEGISLEDAVRRYEKVTAPSNYRRPKALVTQTTLKKARQTIEDLGLLDSLPHRFAHLEDVTVNNVLFADKASARRMRGNVLDDLQAEVNAKPPARLDRVEEITWDKFVRDILPQATQLEVMPEGRHAGNFVSLLAPVNPEAPRLFQWNNGFSWAYSGNLADSMKARVKEMGGDVTGVLRFSIQWNENGQDNNDLDAHCILPKGNEIYFGNSFDYESRGSLDVDIVHPFSHPKTERGALPAVENITWPSLKSMQDGNYSFFVHCYSFRNGPGGFRAEIEADRKLHSFEYPEDMRQSQTVSVAVVTKNGEKLEVKPAAGITCRSSTGSEVWGVKPDEFHPVTAVMFSPNYWDEQEGVGHRHLFFMIDRCVSDENPNGFFNEYLRSELVPHRRVFEVLGSRMAAESDDYQMSGLGFSTSKRNDVLIRVTGAVERILKITF